MADESPFTIRDRRRSQKEPALSQSPDAPLSAEPSASPPPPHRAERKQGAAPSPASFSELLFGLGTSAFAALGVQPAITEGAPIDPSTAGGLSVDLDQARHLIDLLDVLQQKTAGNLTTDEQQLLQQLLYTLRLAFVEQSRSNPVTPPGAAR